MKVKTSELTGYKLDWAVAKCELMAGQDYTLAIDTDFDGTKRVNFGGTYPEWSTDWQEGGPIIERVRITVIAMPNGTWATSSPCHSFHHPTPLIAAMRAYVASKLGDEVELNEMEEA